MIRPDVHLYYKSWHSRTPVGLLSRWPSVQSIVYTLLDTKRDSCNFSLAVYVQVCLSKYPNQCFHFIQTCGTFTKYNSMYRIMLGNLYLMLVLSGVASGGGWCNTPPPPPVPQVWKVVGKIRNVQGRNLFGR
jgi:hypothetical protein